eukprot:5715655-Pyramimonas_sp.AAC.1
MVAACHEVEEAEELAEALEALESDDGQQMFYAAVEHAAASLGRKPRKWPQCFEAQRQRQGIRA